jgi:hypothetical protein
VKPHRSARQRDQGNANALGPRELVLVLMVMVMVMVMVIMGGMGGGLPCTSVLVSCGSRSSDHRLIRQPRRDRSMLPFAHWKNLRQAP